MLIELAWETLARDMNSSRLMRLGAVGALLCATLWGCAKSEINDFANATRSRAEEIAQAAGIPTRVDDLPDMDEDEPAVSRPQPAKTEEAPAPKEAPPLTEMMDPNQPFAPMVEPEPTPTR